MKDNNGKKTTDREEILEICKTFYKSLYEKTVPTPTNTRTQSPDTDDVPSFTKSEVRKCLKDMRKKNHPVQMTSQATCYLLQGNQH
ncbi:hypothetical protein ElyMa_006143000 [Elysia marginata]|uniref:Uncharacterized protein n=1 Tax=Elysia marginata TaxID=1093978 RepID=A0AAV4GX81_9GAST|nr:hypothetical protein ElyMa_006143000 [Elysia marginata]